MPLPWRVSGVICAEERFVRLRLLTPRPRARKGRFGGVARLTHPLESRLGGARQLAGLARTIGCDCLDLHGRRIRSGHLRAFLRARRGRGRSGAARRERHCFCALTLGSAIGRAGCLLREAA
ncbi:MAG: hypothetical protein CBD47_03295 [Synechococcus sp. TMED187]|nr:MAG: hypothetical protein CBD47_03295 [Synechococcus sp. TMED187]